MDNASAKKQTVLLVDNQPLTRYGTKLLLESAGYKVLAETGDGLEAAELADQLQPDVLVTDLDLAMLPGLEVIQQVRRRSPQTTVLVLTGVEACPSVIGAVRAGAHGYCLRSGEVEEFRRALEAVSHGDMYVCPRVARHLVPGRCGSEHEQDCRGLACLTSREVQIIKLVAEGRSSPQIASMLSLAPATVDRHRANLMQKLNLHSVPALVLFAVRCGLIECRRASA